MLIGFLYLFRGLVSCVFPRKPKFSEEEKKNLIFERYPYVANIKNMNKDFDIFLRNVFDYIRNPSDMDEHQYIYMVVDNKSCVIPKKIRKKYPDKMSVVLQNVFEIKEVTNEHFKVQLPFNNKSEELIIPYTSVLVFCDPVIEFALSRILENAVSSATIEDL